MARLASLLLARKTTRQRFRWPLTYEQSRDVLTAAYRAEVEYRHRDFVDSAQCAESIERLARILVGASPKFGIMFCGTCGNGKTTLLYAFRSALNILSDWQVFKERKGIVTVGARDIPYYAKDCKMFHELRAKEMLAVDDMGREPAEVLDYGNVLNPIVDLMEYRYNEQLFTIVTTNMKPDEIRERYGRRISDRFNEMMDVIIFGDGSFRTPKPK